MIVARPALGGEVHRVRDGRHRARGAGAWSHLSDGSSVVWIPPRGTSAAAVDAELEGAAAPAALARAGTLVPGAASDLEAWTRLEVEAKLLDVPVVVLLSDPARRVEDARLRHETVRRGDLVVTVAGWATQP